MQSWDALPQQLLYQIATSPGGAQSVNPTLRCVCRSWKDAMEANLVALAPRRWPPGNNSTRLISRVSSLDLSRLRHPDSASTPPGSPDDERDSGTGLAGPDQEGAAGTSHSSSGLSKNSSQLDLMGAAVLQPRMQDPTSSTAAASLMCYVSSAWPEAVPYVTPAGCLRLWRCLPQLQLLQHLRLSGSMLLIKSVQTAVAGCPDAATGLKLLQQHATDTLASPTPAITHRYTLRVPPGLCSMTGLRSLSLEWCLPHDSDSTGGQASMPVRRRSYEGGGNSGPQVQHVADPYIRLPPQFGQLVNLRSLQLTGHVAGPSTLLALMGLQHLEHLTLGPGRISVHALVPLAAAGVLAGLTQLTLKQQGSWDVDSFVAVVAGVTKLQVLEVQELEMAGAELSAAGDLLPRALTAADVRPLAKTLRHLSWSICSQRLAAGASLLCPSPEAAGLPGQHAGDASAAAAGPWLGGLSGLQCLELCGILKGGSVLGAPALDALSSSIGSCTQLGELSVKCFGVPLLPEALAQLPLLHRVSIEACAVTRRALLGPEAAVAVLARCRELRDITLAGCALRHVPDLAGLQHVTALQLASNYLQDLPATRPCAGLPATLQRLTLTDNRLRDLPDSIAQLSSLSRLVLDSNYLSSLPGCIWDLPSLKELSAKENMLSQLPECGCVSAHSISASAGCASRASARCSSSYSSTCYRPAGALPVMHAAASTATAPHPTQPGLTAGLLQAVRGPTGLSAEEEDLLQAIGVGVLHTSSRGLAVAPVLAPGAGVAVVACKPKQQQRRSCACAGSLRSLVLANNQLTELPASMCQLSSLRELDLSRNQLRALPDKAVIWALTGLTSLQLADNHLHKLPSGLAKLQHLVELDVSGNHLSISMPGPAGLSASTAVAAAGSGRPGMHQGPVRAAAAAPAAAGAAAAATAASESSRQQQQQQDAAVAAAAARTRPALSPAAGRTSSTPAVADARTLVTVVVQDPAARGSSSMGGSQTSVRKKPQALPVPLGRLPQLQQVCLGRQQAEGGSTWRGHCPLQLLLSGLWHLAQNIRDLAPQHQCPVAKAAAAAADLIAGVGSRRATRERELLQRMQSEPGWVLVPALPGKGAPHM